MRYLPFIAVALALAGCTAASDWISKETGTTLAQRCAWYQSGQIAADAAATAFPELAGAAAVDDAAVKAICANVTTK